MRYPATTPLTVLIPAVLSILLLTGANGPEQSDNPKATGGGELSFTIRTVTDNGPYSPKHVLAIWIEHGGDFVKTRKAMANQRKQYLYMWKAASNYNVVDAITGPTLTFHQTHTVTWDCTDLDGNIVPDGDYDVYTEFTDQHAQGPYYMLSFTKGPDAVNMTPADETYFKDIALDFTPWVAEFSANVNDICQWGTVTFTDESVNATSWEWDFGEGAAPATSTSQGPHTVFYTTPGIKTVSLTINGSVTESKTDFISVEESPISVFSFVSTGLTVEFTNLSSNATNYLWEFDDGTTSTEINPTHTYETAGTYDVTLHAYNSGCEDTGIIQVIVPIVGTPESAPAKEFKVFPNPTNGIFHIRHGSISTIEKINIFAPDGERIPLPLIRENGHTVSVDCSGLDAGVYFLQIHSGDEVVTNKVVIR